MNKVAWLVATFVACGGSSGTTPRSPSTPVVANGTPILVLGEATLTGKAFAMQGEEIVLAADGGITRNTKPYGRVTVAGEVKDASGNVFLTISADGKVTVVDDKDKHFSYQIADDGTLTSAGAIALSFGKDGLLTGSEVAQQPGSPLQGWQYVGAPETRRAVALVWIASRMGFRNPFTSRR